MEVKTKANSLPSSVGVSVCMTLFCILKKFLALSVTGLIICYIITILYKNIKSNVLI